MLGRGSRRDTRFPVSIFRQYPRPGLGIRSFLQTRARLDLETPYSNESLLIGVRHTSL